MLVHLALIQAGGIEEVPASRQTSDDASLTIWASQTHDFRTPFRQRWERKSMKDCLSL